MPLQRRVGEHVEQQRQQAERGGEQIGCRGERRQGKRGQRHGAEQRQPGLQPLGGERPLARAQHQGVDVTLQVAVERVGGAHHQGGGEQGEQAAHEAEAPRCDRHAGCRAQHDEQR